MSVPENLRYSKSHEWVRIDGDTATVGITDHAQEELGDVALIQLPEVGRILLADGAFGEIESIKAVSELYSPVGGEVVAINEALEEAPETVNNDPYGDGWLIKLKVASPADADVLLDAAGYNALLEES
ncbi:MAG: glycine cleavage system protein GcvH [Capsulimonadaceae bacterium]|nr:glycine cleavage system protein GcvH [Capsulimonadaceae bacterium]